MEPTVISPSYTIEPITPRQVIVNKDTYLWNLTFDNYTAIVDNPVGEIAKDTSLLVVAIFHHVIGYNYYMTDTAQLQGYDVNDCDSATPPPLPDPPLPSALPNGAVTADSPPYQAIIVDVPGYLSPINAVNKFNSVSTVKSGTNYLFFTSKYGMDNVTLISGQPGAWINPLENVLPAPEPEVLPIEVSTDWTDPRTGGEPDWRTTYVPLNKPERCVAMHDIAVIDLEGIHRNARMRQYDVTPIAGQFIKDDILYGRPESAIIDPNTGIERRWWYGIPMSQLELESAVYNSATDTADRQVTKTLTIHDYFVLLIAKIESKLSKKDKK